ncbi:T9SS type A sorting domain-containing protein [Botryobacter ruber]|uniref:T9SS type A sorting domain-containing protein n=1 Tax=Botryobacter ruber TaxID=2171629 RepID=UPI000FEC3DF8|nr:T9SS type A sorting domain-containing protein [Botryobacter ruber]
MLSYIAVVLVVASAFSAAQAQTLPGTNDASFNTADAVVGAGEGFDSNLTNIAVTAIALQPDGKIVVGGSFTSYNNIGRNRIARLNTDGSLDASFNDWYGFNGEVKSVALQSDGKILVGGMFSTYGGTALNKIARFNADGTLDASFDTGTGFIMQDGTSADVQSIAVQPDGKIVVGGVFSSYNGTSRNGIARLNDDGTIDTSFNSGTGFKTEVVSWYVRTMSVALQPDGKIVVGGSFTHYNNTGRNRIARLNADGTLDDSFDPGTGFNEYVWTIAVQPDGKLVVGGAFGSFNETVQNRIARLNTDGTLDTSFEPGTGFTSNSSPNFVHGIALQPDGKIVAVGRFSSYNDTERNEIARLNADGSLDESFNVGIGFDEMAQSVAVQADGKIVVGGNFRSYKGIWRNKIVRLQADGTLDDAFNFGGGFDGYVSSMALQPDGKIVVGGGFTSYNGKVRSYLARLNADGTLDDAFNAGTGFNSPVSTIVVQPDGKLVVGGSSNSFDGIGLSKIARLNADGTSDASFSSGTGFNGNVLAIMLQPDGKIVVGGSFSEYDGVMRNRIARLNSNGSLDASFKHLYGFDGDVISFALQPDGKIVAGGAYGYYNGIRRRSIVRLNTDGTLDSSFNPGTGFNGKVQSVAVQPDGKIVVGGYFRSYNDIGRENIARLNANGTLDYSFEPSTNDEVRSIVLQSDGKIVMAGNFFGANGEWRLKIARLNADGYLDTSFNPGEGFNGVVNSIVLQPDGKIVAGGWFTTYKQTSRRRIARLFGDEGTSLSAGRELQAGTEVLVYPNPSQGDVQLVFSGAEALVGAVKLVLHDATGRQVLSREVTAAEAQAGVQLITSSLPGGVYFLHIQFQEKVLVKRLVFAE